jgi:hypothetical protein
LTGVKAQSFCHFYDVGVEANQIHQRRWRAARVVFFGAPGKVASPNNKYAAACGD